MIKVRLDAKAQFHKTELIVLLLYYITLHYITLYYIKSAINHMIVTYDMAVKTSKPNAIRFLYTIIYTYIIPL